MLTKHGCSIAPSTFYDAVSRRPLRRQLRDEQLMQLIAAERDTPPQVEDLHYRYRASLAEAG